MMDLDAIPLEVENGSIVRVCATTDAEGRWRIAWMRDGGRKKEPFGDPFPNGTLAARASLRINARADRC